MHDKQNKYSAQEGRAGQDRVGQGGAREGEGQGRAGQGRVGQGRQGGAAQGRAGQGRAQHSTAHLHDLSVSQVEGGHRVVLQRPQQGVFSRADSQIPNFDRLTLN